MVSSRTLVGLRAYLPWGLLGNASGAAHLFPQMVLFHLFGTSVYALRLVAALYGVAAPRANACKAPRVWQSFDIEFHPPLYRAGQKVANVRLTVWQVIRRPRSGYFSPIPGCPASLPNHRHRRREERRGDPESHDHTFESHLGALISGYG